MAAGRPQRAIFANSLAFLLVFLVGGVACHSGIRASHPQNVPDGGGAFSLDVGVGSAADVGLDLPVGVGVESVRDGGFDLAADVGSELAADGGTESSVDLAYDGGVALAVDGGSVELGAIAGGGRVSGTVVAIGWGYGTPGRTVVIGSQSTTTKDDGSFTFDQVPDIYDAMIVEPDGTQVSIYYGLTRRNPILSHTASYSSDLDDPTQMVSISGTLSGDGFPFPVDSGHLVTLYFLADRGHGSAQVTDQFGSPGPDYGPIRVGWDGDSSVTGTVVALGQYGSSATPWLGAFLGSKAVTLAGGGAVKVDLTLSPLSMGRIAGTVQMYPGNAVLGVSFGYHLPGTKGKVGFDKCSTKGAFDCELPDLSTLGGEYCLDIEDEHGSARATKCGAAIGMTDFSIQVQTPPTFQNPPNGSSILKSSKLFWSAIQNGVYLLDAGPDIGTPTAPHIQAYISATQILWPDLQAIGVQFPIGTTYTCIVTGLVPYQSIDDLASSRGLSATQMDRQQLDSAKVVFKLK